jgi:hypothetical protein
MKTQILTAIILVMVMHCSYSIASETKTHYPEITGMELTKAQDIKPFCISSNELASIIQDLTKEPSSVVMAGLRNILRKHAILPSGYEGLLTNYCNRTQVGRYDIGVGPCGTLHVCVDQKTRIITDFYSSISSSSPYVLKSNLANPLSDSQGRGLLHNFLSLNGENPEQLAIATAHFGQHTLLFFVYCKYITPSVHTIYVLDRRIGGVCQASLESLAAAINAEFPVPNTEEDYKALIKMFIRLNSPLGGDILSGLADIRQYETHKLDPDIEAALRPPFRTSDKRHPIVYVCYTYRITGGVVERYRFPFRPDGRLDTPSCVLLGRDIGAAQYLE